MLQEVMDYLNLKKGDIVLDATAGGGGHALEVLKKILPGGRLIGIDADRSALAIAAENLKDFKGSFTLINDNFRNLDIILSGEGIDKLDAVLFDIGISSDQLAQAVKGFSIQENGPLDMRMDERLTTTAYDIVNKYKEKELSGIIERFGEERFHKRVARFIVEARAREPIKTTHELAQIVRRAVGFRNNARIDSATRTFQAIRIAVNDELGALEDGLKRAVALLGTGARIAVISFHSLEDRIVKNMFKGYAGLGLVKILTKKPVVSNRYEIASNPRSRSAKLRVAERI